MSAEGEYWGEEQEFYYADGGEEGGEDDVPFPGAPCSGGASGDENDGGTYGAGAVRQAWGDAGVAGPSSDMAGAGGGEDGGPLCYSYDNGGGSADGEVPSAAPPAPAGRSGAARTPDAKAAAAERRQVYPPPLPPTPFELAIAELFLRMRRGGTYM